MSTKSAPRVIVGLSGGVDSAVAALLLKEQGLDVQGLFLSNWEEDDAYCTAAQDFQDARAVARELDIPLHRASFAAEYRARVSSALRTASSCTGHVMRRRTRLTFCVRWSVGDSSARSCRSASS